MTTRLVWLSVAGQAELGMQCDWLENEHATYPKPIILASQLHYLLYHFTLCCLFFQVVNRL
ncbi:hypothetical protein BYT27DRAFT_7203411 [Phlegmacium glaucopus]|nr:hypothetical protein BYT27DRAFT_7203411 [Phlegmacium glaucopus]